jgi:ferric-dicitrate binding protein FerR (iron transport regulator)
VIPRVTSGTVERDPEQQQQPWAAVRPAARDVLARLQGLWLSIRMHDAATHVNRLHRHALTTAPR